MPSGDIHMRDTALWMSPEGIHVEWTRMGEGTVGIGRYVRAFVERCPGRLGVPRSDHQSAAGLRLPGSRLLAGLSQDAGLGLHAVLRPRRAGPGAPRGCPGPADDPGRRDGQHRGNACTVSGSELTSNDSRPPRSNRRRGEREKRHDEDSPNAGLRPASRTTCEIKKTNGS